MDEELMKGISGLLGLIYLLVIIVLCNYALWTEEFSMFENTVITLILFLALLVSVKD